jgi:hypothetical protein
MSHRATVEHNVTTSRSAITVLLPMVHRLYQYNNVLQCFQLNVRLGQYQPLITIITLLLMLADHISRIITKDHYYHRPLASSAITEYITY